MMHFNPGDHVEILESGVWTGPFQVTDKVGRTPDHLVLASDSNLFELYNDYPFNVRLVSVPVRDNRGTDSPSVGEDKLNLGYVVGKRYKVWTGDIDLVMGYDENGWVIVQDEKTGEIRKHLTTCSSEPLEDIHPENHLEPSEIDESTGVDMWCFTCDTWVDVENFTYSDIKDGALLQHVVDGIAHDPSIFRKF